MFGSQNISEILQSHSGSSKAKSSLMYDIHDSPTWKREYSPNGLFNGDKRGISLAFCTDGVNPFSHNQVAYSMWQIMLTSLNLPRKIRNFFSSIFKPGARGALGFLKLLWFARRYVCVCVCVSVCPPPRPLITSGVIWCDIGRVRLVKQVLRLFPAFNYFIRH